MAKRKLLQWMRDALVRRATDLVVPPKEKKALDAAYKKAAPRAAAIVQKKFPAADMKVLAKWRLASTAAEPKFQLPNGSIIEFSFDDADAPQRPDEWSFRNQIYLADAAAAEALEAWRTAKETYEAERAKRLTAYKALIAGASYVDDLIELWPEAKEFLPAGSPPIPLGPEQLALVKSDQRERKAA